MLDIGHEVLCITACIEGFALILTNTALLERNDVTHMDLVGHPMRVITPDSNWHAAV